MKSLLRRIALVAVGAAVGLAAGELLVRAFGPEIQVVFRNQIVASDDPALGYGLRPGAPDGKGRISSAGLRDREYAQPKPPGVTRIAAIGDSITFGVGNKSEQSYPKRLEGLLGGCPRASEPGLEVLNLGVPGYNIEQVAEALRRVGLPFEPDAVIYGYSLNDPQAFSIEADALATLRTAFESESGAGLGRWLSYSRLYLLARRIGFERVKQEALRAHPPSDPAFLAEQRGAREEYFRALHSEGESAARLERGLDTLAAIARERSLPVLVVIFPLFGTENGVGPEALADVHARVAAAAERRGFAVVDLLPVYGDRSGARLSLDFMHPNPLGHQIAAEAVLGWMCRNAWPPGVAIDCSCAAASGAP